MCSKVVERYGGILQPPIGRTAMALFGYPKPTESATRLAVAAGIALIDNFKHGQRFFRIRAGVARSLAIVEFTERNNIASEAFEEASVLARCAGANELLVSESVRELMEEHLMFSHSGQTDINERPLRFWRVIHTSIVHSGFDAIQPKVVAPLVGREHEMQFLLRQWRLALEGRGRVTLVGGEPGVGKSRLVRELKQHASQHLEAKVTLCSCSQMSANSTLGSIVECLERSWFETDTPAMSCDDKLAVIKEAVTELGLEMPTAVLLLAQLLDIPARNYPPLEVTPERHRFLMLRVLVDLVIERASRQPLLLILEDLQWADPATLEWVGMLISRAPAVPLFVVLTHRPDFVPELSNRGQVSLILLDRLSDEECLAIVPMANRGPALDAEAMQWIVKNSDGVPLFVEEIAKAVAVGGVPLRPAKMTVPSSLRDLFAARLDQLGANREVLCIASILGREFSYGLLLLVVEMEKDRLQQIVELLVNAGIFYVRGAGTPRTLRFKHELLRSAAYDSLFKKQRQGLHRRAAESLLRHFPELVSRQPEVVAEHFVEAGLEESSVIYWHQASMLALQRSAHPEALSHFERGLEVLRRIRVGRSNSERRLLTPLPQSKV